MLSEDTRTTTTTSFRGLKIALVVSNQDPKHQERILGRVLGIHNLANETFENAVWMHHCAPFRDASGDLPEPGDYVWVLFPQERDPMTIVWLGYVRSSFQEDVEGEGYTEPTEPNSVSGLGLDTPYE